MRKYKRLKLSFAERLLIERRRFDLKRIRFITGIMLASLLGWFANPSYAAPQGEQVVAGDVSFDRNGTLTEITASNNSIINYNSFDIAQDETVRFIQPSDTSRVLNRITGADPTTIAGQLLSNGQVYIVNPAGIYFTNGSLVDVGELYAAAGSITDTEFLAGNDHFSNVQGEVVNDGTILAETVALVGQYVANNGDIFSNDGIITLAVGNDVYLTRQGSHVMVQVGELSDNTGSHEASIENNGNIDAGSGSVSLVSGDLYSLAMGISSTGSIKGAEITLESGDNGMTVVSGKLDADNKAVNSTGGDIKVLGDRVGLFGADISADGINGGGEILIGGDQHGEGNVKTAEKTIVDSKTNISADALETGDGGIVVCWANGMTLFEGVISAYGGSESGDGGFVEVSGKDSLQFSGSVDTSAVNGSTGTLLLDPYSIFIVSGVGVDDGEIADFSILGGEGGMADYTISEGTLELLTAGNNITMEALLDIEIVSLTDNILDFNTAGGNTITFKADSNDNGTGDFIMANNHTIRTAGGSVVINGVNVSIGSVLTNGGDITVTADEMSLNTALNSGAGTIHIYPRTSMAMDIGAFTDGLDISNAELNRITTSGTLIIGDDTNTSSMELEGVTDIANVTGTVRFMSNGTINSTDTWTNTITTPLVEILADDGVYLRSFLAVGRALLINADYDSDSTGSFRLDAADDTVTSTNDAISIVAANLIFNSTAGTMIDGGSGIVTITASNNRTMGIGSGNCNISDAELDCIASTDTVVLDTASAFTVSENVTHTGNLAIVAGSSVTQTNLLNITGDLSVTTDVANQTITLTNTSNSVSGAVSFNTLGATGNVTYTENADLDLGAGSVGGNLTLDSNGNDITDSGAVSIGGDLAISDTDNVTLNQLTGDIDLAASTITTNAVYSVVTGSITQAGALTIGGTATFTTTTNNEDITLSNTSNAVQGDVSLNTAGTSGNAVFDNGSTDLDLGNGTINGTLDIDTSGHLTVNGNYVTTGTAHFSVDDVTMAAGSINTGTSTLTIAPDDNGTIGLGLTGGNMSLSSAEVNKLISGYAVIFDTNSNITVDGLNSTAATGVFLDSEATVSFINNGSTFGQSLAVSCADIDVAQTVNCGANLFWLMTAGTTDVYLGTAGAGISFTGAELQNITCGNFTVTTGNGEDIFIDNVTAANSNNISGTFLLDAADLAVFQNNNSTFNILDVQADDGITVSAGLTIAADTGNLTLDGNVGGSSTITTAGAANFSAAGTLTINEITANGAIDLTAGDLAIAAAMTLGANNIDINTSGNIGIGSAAGAMAISGTELQRINTSGSVDIITTGGAITVDNITAANSNNITGTLTLQAAGAGAGQSITFSGNNSTFNTLDINADDGIYITNVLVGTDVGDLNLDSNYNTAADGYDRIKFSGLNAGMFTANNLTVTEVDVTDALTLKANGDITLAANQDVPDGVNIIADMDANGTGNFYADGFSINTSVGNGDINIAGAKVFTNTLNAGTGTITFVPQVATDIYLGGTDATHYNITSAELSDMSASEIVIGDTSATFNTTTNQFTAVAITGDFDATNKAVAIQTSGAVTISDAKTLTTTDKDISISANDLVMNTSGAINAGTGALSIAVETAGKDILLGGSNGAKLDIDDTELSHITSGSLTLTVKSDDDVYIDGITNADGENAGSIIIDASADNSRVYVQNSAVVVDALTITADDGLVVEQNITADTGNLILEADADDVGEGTDAISDMLDISGNLTFRAAGDISFLATTGNVDVNGDVTIVADSDNNGTGTFTTDIITTNNGDISITAEDVVLRGLFTAGSGNVTILPSNSGGQTFSFGAAGGDLELLAIEVGYINTSGNLVLGNANTTSLTVTTDPTNVTGNISLIATGTNGNIVVNGAITPNATLVMTANGGITVSDDITTGSSITIDADNDDAGNGTLSVGAGVSIDSTDSIVSVTAKDIDINSTGVLDSGTAAMSITQSQAAGSIGLGGTAGTMTITDTEMDNITANNLTIFAPSDVTVNAITNNGGNIAGTFLVDAAGKVTFASGNSDFRTLAVQADDGVEVNTVTVSTGVGSIVIDANVDDSADGTDKLAFIGAAALNAKTVLTLTSTNDGITSAGATDLDADGLITISDAFTASSSLSIQSASNAITFSNNFTGGGITQFDSDDGITFNGNVSLGGSTTIDCDTDAGDDSGTFTLAALKTLTTNGNTLSVTADNVDLAGSITGGAGLLTFTVSDGATMGLADGAGIFSVSSAELTRITGQTGGVTFSGSNGLVTVNGMTTASNMAGISGMVTIDASNDGSSVSFTGANCKYTALTVDSDSGIAVSVDLETTNGNMVLEGDADNADDAGADAITFSGNRTVTVAGGSLTMDATTSEIINSTGSLTLKADDGVTVNNDITVNGQVNIDADLDNDTTGTLTLNGVIDSSDNQIDIIADDIVINGSGGMDSGLSNVRITPSTAISMGLGAGAGTMSLTDTELDLISANNFYLGMGVATDLLVNNYSSTTIFGDYFINITGTMTISGGSLNASASNNDFDIIADDLNYTAGLNSGSGAIRYRTSDGGGIFLGTAGAGMSLTSAELAQITTTGNVTFETAANEDIELNNITAGSTNNIGGTITLDADADKGQVNFTNNASVLRNNVVVKADDGVDIDVNLTVQAGNLTVFGDTDSTNDGNGRDNINIADGVVIEATAGNMQLTAAVGDISADGALTLIAGGYIQVDDSLTINADVGNTNKALLIEAADLNFNGSAINADAGAITIRPVAAANMGLGDTASGAFDLTDAEFDKITTSGIITFGGATANHITVDNFTAPATVTGEVRIISGQDNGDITFTNNASSFQGALRMQAFDDIILNESISTGGAININVDSDTDNDGLFSIASGKTLVSNDNVINITASDIALAGGTVLPARNINAGTANLTITDSDGTGIALGGSSVVNGINLTDAEFGQLKAANVEFVSSGNIVVDGITAANSQNITTLVTLDTASDIQFSNNASTFNGLVCEANGNIQIDQNVTTDTGVLEFYSDFNGNAPGNSMTFATGVTVQAETSLVLDASLAGSGTSGISAAGTLTVNAKNGININNDLTAGGLLTINADKDANGTGALTIANGADVNAAANNVDITANSITFGTGTLTNVDDLDLNATINGNLVVNGDFGNSGSVSLTSVNGSITINSDVSTNKSMTLTAKDGITINNNVTADADANNAGNESIVINADSDGDGTGTIVLKTDGKTVTTNNNDITITAADFDMQGTYAIGAGTGTITIVESYSDGIDIGGANIAGSMGISTSELQRLTAAVAEFNTAGDVSIDNVLQANSANITSLIVDNAGQCVFENNASEFKSVTVESDDGIDIAVNITASNGGSISLDGDADIAADTNDNITIAAGITLQADNTITLAAQTGKITAAGTLDLISEDDITINDNLTAADDLTIDTDGITVNDDGTGDLIVAADATISTQAVNKDIIIQANDMFLNGYMNTGTGTIDITVSDNNDYYLGSNAVENGSNNGYNINATELSHVYTGNLILATAGDVDISDVLAGAADNITYMVTFDIDGHATVSNDCIFNAITINANDGINLGGNLTSQSGDINLDGDANNADDGNGLDNIVFASNSTVSSADELRLNSTTGDMSGTGALVLEGANGIYIYDNLSTNGNLTINADTDLDGNGDLYSAPGKTYSCNNNDLSITAANVAFDSGITNVNGLFLTATTGDMIIDGIISFNNTGDLGLAVTNGTCVINKQLTAAGSITISSSDGITIRQNITSNGDMIINADNDADASGDLAVDAGVQIVSNAGVIEITAKDISDLSGTLNSGIYATKIDSTGIGIGIGNALSTGMNFSNLELANITAAVLEFVTDGDIEISSVDSSSNVNIGTVILDSVGSIRFSGGESTFNTLDVQAEGGIIIDGDVTTDTGELFFNNDSTCKSGGNQGIEFGDDVVVTSAQGLTIGGGGDLYAEGIVTFAAEGDFVIESDFEIEEQLIVEIEDNTFVIDGAEIKIVDGTAEIYAGDIDISGKLICENGTITITPDGKTVGLGSAAGTMKLDSSELASITAKELYFDAGGFIHAENIQTGSTDEIELLTLDSQAEVFFSDVIFESDLVVLAKDAISQNMKLVVTGDTILETINDDKGIMLGNSENSLQGTVQLTTHSSGQKNADVIFNNGMTAVQLLDSIVSGNFSLTTDASIDMQQLTVAGDCDIAAGNDIVQSDMMLVDGNLTATVNQDGYGITLNNSGNAIVGSVAFYSGSDGDVVFDNGDDDILFAQAEIGGDGSFRTTAEITDDGSVVITGDTSLSTYNDSGSDIVLDNAENAFGTLDIHTYKSSGTIAADGDIIVVENDAIVFENIYTAGNLTLQAAGNITEIESLRAGNIDIDIISDSGGNVQLNADNAFGTLDVNITDTNGEAAAGDVTIRDNGVLQIDSISTIGDISLIADDLALAGSLTGTTLDIQPLNESTNIYIGQSAASGLSLDNDEIARLTDGFNTINIGSSNHTGNISLATTEFTDPIRIITSGNMVATGTISGTDNASLYLASGQSFTIYDDIMTNGKDIYLAGNNISITDAISISTSSDSGAVTISGDVGTTNGLYVTAGDTITIDGDYSNTGGGELLFDADLVLADDIAINADMADVTITGQINGLKDLTIEASDADIVFGTDIGLGEELANLSVITTNSGTIAFNSIINVAGNIYLSSDQDIDYVPADATIFKASQGDLVFNVGGSFEIGLNNRVTVSDGNFIVNTGSGDVTLGDVTAKGNIEITASNAEGDIVILLRDKTYSYTANADGTIKLVQDRGVNIAAEGYIKFNGEIIPDGDGPSVYFVTGNKPDCDGLTGYKVYTVNEFDDLIVEDEDGNNVIIVYIPVSDNLQLTVDAIAAAMLRDRNNIYYDNQIAPELRDMCYGQDKADDYLDTVGSQAEAALMSTLGI